MNHLLTVEEAAEILRCTPAAVRKWLYQRRLLCVKLGRLTRLRREDVEDIITNGLPDRRPRH
jgi:excisionase family DNA binding protein